MTILTRARTANWNCSKPSSARFGLLCHGAPKLALDTNLLSRGPVIAIGRPKEKLPPIGAARLYAGRDWKKDFSSLLQRARLTLMVAGDSPGFRWELAEVFRNEPFTPTILILPFFQSYKQAKVDTFLRVFREQTGLSLPNDLRSTRVAYFPTRNEAMILTSEATAEEKLLNSYNAFLGPISRIMATIYPGWTKQFIVRARQAKSRRTSWTFLALAIGSLIMSRACTDLK